MRRITSALGLSRNSDAPKRSDATPKRLFPPAPKPTTYLSRTSANPRASESTPALVHHIPDSSSSSGVRTPSDVEGADLLSVPIVHAASASLDSFAHSARSNKSFRWLPATLIRSIKRKRRASAPPPSQPLVPPSDLRDDGSTDSHSTHSSRPRSPPPPAFLHPPAPPFAGYSSRRTSSPASSTYRAGLANVQRRAPPSRANLALHAFTQPLVFAAGAPTPHPLTTPDPASPALFPRSVSRCQPPPSHSLRTHVHRARVLRRLEEGTLTSAEESSIMPFASRTPRSPPVASRRMRPSATTEEAVAEPGAGTGRWSRGLRRWVARPVFEDRMSVFCPSSDGVCVDMVRPARGLGTEMLDFSDGTLALAGLALDSDSDSDSDLSHLPAPRAIKPPLQIQTNAAQRRRSSLQPPSLSPSPSSPGTTATGPATPRATSPPGIEGGTYQRIEAGGAGSGSGQGRKASIPAVRGVRFADDDDATDGDDLPLAVLVAVQKKRAEREARARHQTLMGEQARREREQAHRYDGELPGLDRGRDKKQRSYAEEIARARMLRDSARAGVERPASFVRETESKRESQSPARPAGAGHSRTGSGGVNTHRRRNTVGEANLAVPTSPAPPLPGIPASPIAPASPGLPMAGLPSSAPSTTSSFPVGFGSSGYGFPSPSPSFSQLPHSNSFPLAHSHSGSVSGLSTPQLPFATRSLSSSPLRASFALPSDEFGVAGGNPMLNNAIMVNNAVIANNAAMLAAHSAMISGMGMPSPAFAGNASASGSLGAPRGRTSAYGTGPRSHSQGRSATGRPGPTPMQMSGGSSIGDRRSTAGDRRSTTGDKRSTTGDRRGSTTGEQISSSTRSYTQSQTQSRRGGHAHSKSELSTAGRPTSKLNIVSQVQAPPVPIPSVPTGVYSSRSRPRPGTEVIT